MNSPTPFPGTTPPPMETKHLNPAEWLVLYTFRRWLSGLLTGDPRQWELAWRELSNAMGQKAARQSLGALEGLLRILMGFAARRIRHHQACCGVVAPDESLLLRLVASAQHENLAEAETLAAMLVSQFGVAEAVAAAKALATALRSGGVGLPLRPADCRMAFQIGDVSGGPRYSTSTVTPYSSAASSSQCQRYSAKLRRT